MDNSADSADSGLVSYQVRIYIVKRHLFFFLIITMRPCAGNFKFPSSDFPYFFTLLSISAQRLVFSQRRLSTRMSYLFQRRHLALVRLFADQRQADDIE